MDPQHKHMNTECICTFRQMHTDSQFFIFDKIPGGFGVGASSCKMSVDQCVVFSLCRVCLV